MQSVRLCLLFAFVAGAYSAATSKVSRETIDPRVQTIYNDIQWTLAKLNHPTGMAAEELGQMASKIANDIQTYLDDVNAVVRKEDIGRLVSVLATTYINNLTALTTLFADVLSLQAAKMDSAFILMDKLSEMIVNPTDQQQLYTVLTAIMQTAEAVRDVVVETSQIFNYMTDQRVTRGERETTISGHVERGPHGTSGGISVSHTWGRK